jgi:acetylornithine deacetylase/succinyl-diaminopimelate desuccinylase-like protein
VTRIALVVIATLLAGCSTGGPERFITAERLRDDIAYLSDDSFQGRSARSPEARRAAEWIAGRFASAGLEPLPGGDGFFHGVSDPRMAPNVIGIRRGRGEDFVLVTAHYDHLPPARSGDDRIYNGADDNASGTAGVIAIAEAMARAKVRTDASVVFVAFTGEEMGLRGSRHLAGRPPFPLARVRGMFNLDMISRGEEDLIFVDGPKNADNLRDALRRANERGKLGLRIRFDEHPEWLQRSDQGPFIYRKVPAVLLSVEDHPDYHEVTDEVDRILPRLAERVAKLVMLAAMEMALEDR